MNAIWLRRNTSRRKGNDLLLPCTHGQSVRNSRAQLDKGNQVARVRVVGKPIKIPNVRTKKTVSSDAFEVLTTFHENYKRKSGKLELFLEKPLCEWLSAKLGNCTILARQAQTKKQGEGFFKFTTVVNLITESTENTTGPAISNCRPTELDFGF